ncbi:guanine nucleotide-binding protein G(I)/G(S)/G(O) subunit gamma-8 isoform X1 [Grammomys surdaster]|nr:guanine nucleotide-binding protein G(I)/G(S)/G(O) subunit gamma-8 isoform X1 [Grammomys surdaster]XP_028635363.1 guanine nucleotide-binding protein G(I)/G(S)/G(O) subunit gamma-8 isoform X1 [Grammomys surdaster]
MLETGMTEEQRQRERQRERERERETETERETERKEEEEEDNDDEKILYCKERTQTDPGHGDRWCLGGEGGPEGLHPRGGGGAGKGTSLCLCQPLSPASHPSPELQQAFNPFPAAAMSNNMAKIAEARKTVEQLKLEVNIDRMKVSQAAAELLAFCETHAKDDPLVTPVPAAENPFRDKRLFCTLL